MEKENPHARFVKFRYALPDIMISTLCLLASEEAREVDPWLDRTHASMSSDLRRDLRCFFAPFGAAILFDRLLEESPVLDDVTSFIGWLASLDDDVVARGVQERLRVVAERHHAPTEPMPDIHRVTAMIWPDEGTRMAHILQDPIEFKGILVFTIARFWQHHFKSEHAECARQIERNVKYVHHRSYSGSFSEYYAEVTGTPLPHRAVEEHPQLETLLFVPCCHGGERTVYIRLGADGRRIVILYNCLLAREDETDARLPLRDMHGAFRALSDATRLEILALLDGRELFAQQIVERLSIGQSTVSRHLRVMVDAGLISERPENGMKFYRIRSDRLAGLARQLGLFRGPRSDSVLAEQIEEPLR